MDFLDEQEFYEVCQTYRHAPDTPSGTGCAHDAFEALKQYIRERAKVPEIKEQS